MSDSTQEKLDESNFLSLDDEHIVNSLTMAIAQIEMSILESGQSVDLALEAVSETSNCLTEVRSNLCHCPEIVAESVSSNIDKATQELQKAIVAFQFFDRLTQRIAHIQENLASVSNLIQEPTKEHPLLWVQLQEKMKSVYSQEQERKLYSVLSKSGVGTLKPEHVKPNQESTDDSIEIF